MPALATWDPRNVTMIELHTPDNKASDFIAWLGLQSVCSNMRNTSAQRLLEANIPNREVLLL